MNRRDLSNTWLRREVIELPCTIKRRWDKVLLRWMDGDRLHLLMKVWLVKEHYISEWWNYKKHFKDLTIYNWNSDPDLIDSTTLVSIIYYPLELRLQRASTLNIITKSVTTLSITFWKRVESIGLVHDFLDNQLYLIYILRQS